MVKRSRLKKGSVKKRKRRMTAEKELKHEQVLADIKQNVRGWKFGEHFWIAPHWDKKIGNNDVRVWYGHYMDDTKFVIIEVNRKEVFKEYYDKRDAIELVNDLLKKPNRIVKLAKAKGMWY